MRHPKTTKAVGRLGTVSHGTMRAEHLIPAFMSALDTLDPRRAAGIAADPENAAIIADPDEHEYADEFVSDLFDILDEYAPKGAYFGAIEGDGSDYGFWKCPKRC